MIRAVHVACGGGGLEGKYEGVLCGNVKDGHHSHHLGVVWEDDIKMYLHEVGWGGME